MDTSRILGDRARHPIGGVSPSHPEPGVTSMLRFIESRCLALRSRFGSCDHCVTACPVHALDIGESGLEVTDACVGCGRCAAVCPTSALAVAGFEFEESSVPEQNALFVECARVPAGESPRGAIRIPCLGGLSPARLIEFKAKAGRSGVTVLDRGWCRTCPAGDLAEHPASEAIRVAQSLLRKTGIGDQEMPRIERWPLPPRLQQDFELSAVSRTRISRRGFLRAFVGGEASPLLPKTGTGVTDIGARRQYGMQSVPPERARVLAALGAIAERTGHALPGDLFPSVTINQSCGIHLVCTKLCPTGALRVYADTESTGVAFDAEACIACGDCERACPQQAIRLMPGRGSNAGQPIRLTHRMIRTCAECDCEFTGSDGERVCPECRKTRDLSRFLFSFHSNVAFASGAASTRRPTENGATAQHSNRD